MRIQKQCKDCKYCVLAKHLCEYDNYRFARCKRTTSVDGMEKWYCSTHRKIGYIGSILLGLCGKRGRYFSEKHV